MSSLEMKEIADKLTIPYLMDNLSWWKLYIAKARLLLIRPRIKDDRYTELFSFPAAGLVKKKAISERWIVKDLRENDATRENVTKNIKEKDPDFVIQYDHGSKFILWGQKAGVLERALDWNNVRLLKGRAVSTVSCLSAGGLGPMAISTTTKAYLGYDALHWVHVGYLKEFTEASNAANYALLEGKTFKEAYKIGYYSYTQNLWALPSTAWLARSLMKHDRTHLTLLGNGQAQAY